MKYISFLLSLCLCASVFAQNPQTYFTKEEMTNLVKCLPAPPDSGSQEFANDILRYMWGKTMRQDAERAAEIEHDAIWNLDTLAVIFSVPFGLEISQEKTPEIYKAFTQSVGTIELVRIIPKAYYNDQSNASLWESIYDVPDEKIWATRQELKMKLFDYIKAQFREDWLKHQGDPSRIVSILEKINPNALTIGFARRFATYKRAHLLFSDLDRLALSIIQTVLFSSSSLVRLTQPMVVVKDLSRRSTKSAVVLSS